MKAFSNPQYAAFEGAGGKGVIYVGVVKALEFEDRLPMTPAKRSQCPEQVLKGISGASAGAITAFFIALGATSEDMSELTAIVDSDHILLEKDVKIKSGERLTGQLIPKSDFSEQELAGLKDPLIVKKNQSVFSLLYDPPSPGVVKAVGKVGNEENKSGFVRIHVEKSVNLDQSQALKIKKFALQIGLLKLKTFLVDRLLIRGILSRILPNVEVASSQRLRSFFIEHSLIQLIKLQTFKFRLTFSEVIADRDAALENGKRISEDTYSMLFPSLPETLLGIMSTFALNKKGKKKQRPIKSSNVGNNPMDDSREEEPTDLEMMFFNSTEDTKNYVYSAFFDKGIFTGLSVNRLLAAKMSYYLRKNFNSVKSSLVCANMNFFDFVNLTGNDLRLAVTNQTQHQPALFSCYLTPDFPVIDAVAASMAIPIAFKPSFFNGTVRLHEVSAIEKSDGSLEGALYKGVPEEPDSEHNKSYRGFFCDGGTLMNLPIHAFDYVGNEPNYKRSVVQIKKNMIGIRNAGGKPKSKDEDPNFEQDPLWQCYTIYDPPLKGTKNIHEVDNGFSNDATAEIRYDWSGGFSPLFDNVGDILGTLLYSMEEGQIRSLDELEATSNFYSYGIDTLDFAVGKHLLAFTQARAFIKMAVLLGIEESKISDVAFRTYYEPHLVRMSDEEKFNPPFDEDSVKKIIGDYTDKLSIYLNKRKRSIYNLNE